MFTSKISSPQNTPNFTSFRSINPRKFIISGSHSVSSATNLSNLGKCFSQKHSVFFRNKALTAHPTRELIKTRISKGVFGDKDIEQESSIDDISSKVTRLESTINHLSKWLVTALFGCITLYRHDAEAQWAALGYILNYVLSNVLKQILNQERPVSTIRPASVSYQGMPSSHAQFSFFAVSFPILSIVQWLGLNLLTGTLIGVLVAVSSYISWLRIAQEFHTVSQVVVGAVIGSIFSVFWFWVWDVVMAKLFLSYLWVRISLFVCWVGYFFTFLVYVSRYWIIGAR